MNKGQSSTHSTRGVFRSRFHLPGGFWCGVGDLVHGETTGVPPTHLRGVVSP